MKIRQLEATDLDELDPTGLEVVDKEFRDHYVKALRWAIRMEIGNV